MHTNHSPNNVDEVPNFTTCTLQQQTCCCKNYTRYPAQDAKQVINMNPKRIDTLLSLIPMAFKLLYKQEWMMNPNTDF